VTSDDSKHDIYMHNCILTVYLLYAFYSCACMAVYTVMCLMNKDSLKARQTDDSHQQEC